jgi:multidrug resistance efflux pump
MALRARMQAKGESSDERQREFQARLARWEAEMSSVRERQAAADEQLAQAAQQLDGARSALRAKEGEVQQLQGRWALSVCGGGVHDAARHVGAAARPVSTHAGLCRP